MKSLLYAANTSSQTLPASDVINFGSVVRQYGCNCSLSGGNAVVRGCGYYTVDASVMFEGSGAGNVALTLYADGVAVPGAVATITTAADTEYTLSLPSSVVRTTCECDKTLTVVLSGTANDPTSATIRVVKG